MADRAPRTAPRRRRWARLTVLGLIVVLTVLTATWAVSDLRTRQPLPTRAPGTWVFAVDLEPPPGWTLTAHGVTADLESLVLQYQFTECQVSAVLPSAPQEYRLPPPAVTEPVRVNGRSGSYSTSYPSAKAYPSDNREGDAGLRVAYGDDGVLDVVCDPLMARVTGIDIRRVVLDLAERLEFSSGEPLLLPFTLDRVPPGLEIVSVQYQNGASDVLLTSAGDPSRPDRAVGITVTPHRSQVAGRPTVVDGTPVELWLGSGNAQICQPVERQFACVQLTDSTIPLENPDAPAAQRGVALVTEIMRDLRVVADVEDRGTWFAAEDALPS